jgi:hypothetical protein
MFTGPLIMQYLEREEIDSDSDYEQIDIDSGDGTIGARMAHHASSSAPML